MEPLRWILLAAGIVFVIVIYLLGRSRRRRNHSMVDALEDELPEFSANNLDDVDEGVGEVRIITGGGPNAIEDAQYNDDTWNTDEAAEVDTLHASGEKTHQQESSLPSDIIVLYILPKPEKVLHGAQINSSAQAMGLSFGEMSIFHFRPKDRNIFSLANMLEPGSFDPDTIHDLQTSGLTVFMQLAGNDPMDDLTEMLQRSYQLAGLLDARLCNHRREPLTEQDAENYRTRVREFAGEATRTTAEGKTPELS